MIIFYDRSDYHVLAHGIDDGVMVGAFANDDKYGIVTGYRAENLRYLTVVNVVGNAAGISRARAYHAEVAREVDALKKVVG